MKHQQYFLAPAICLAALALAGTANATLSGVCSNCHTMHAMQGGAAPSGGSGINGNNYLLLNTCVGCHTGTNTDPGPTHAPYVWQTTAPTYAITGSAGGGNTLAGGNFYWVATTGGADHTKGHNVSGISAIDPNFTDGTDEIPGSSTTYSTYNAGAGMNCAGTKGCHGEVDEAGNDLAMVGTHHETAANRTSNAYRFIEVSNGTDLAGAEDPDWEYTVTTAAHNGYKGYDRNLTGADNDIDAGAGQLNTISSFCARCHGDFHHDDGAVGTGTGIHNDAQTWDTDPWIRHPVDFDMPNTGEYASYTTYSLLAPVAMATPSLTEETITPGTDESIVMCLSCHRAHGSPYADLMRWSYTAANCIAGGGADANCGCFACHTTKD